MVARIFPTPRRYSLAWSHPRGKDHLYVWRAVSPDEDYIALGCVATTGTTQSWLAIFTGRGCG